MATPAIDVRNLTKNYGPVLAVEDVSFQVQPGELVGFLGPNGAGKSTCMRVLTTWLPASSGYAGLAAEGQPAPAPRSEAAYVEVSG